jgi:hypothetical protein
MTRPALVLQDLVFKLSRQLPGLETEIVSSKKAQKRIFGQFEGAIER